MELSLTPDQLGSLLVLVPARGGSKRLPGKNVMKLGGVSLIERAVVAAHRAGLPRVVVSTDDDDIAKEARRVGAMVPFMRPQALASDDASSVDVALHALKVTGNSYETVLLIQPTSPLRTEEDIQGALSIYFTERVQAVVSVRELDINPSWVFRQEKGVLRRVHESSEASPPRMYALNGAIYVVDAEVLKGYRTFMPPVTRPYVMPFERSVDIDTPADARLAEILLRGSNQICCKGDSQDGCR